jgi:hypothetical protein
MKIIPGVYRHYKGAYYLVFNVVTHSETREALVSYRCLYGDYSWWVRPVDMFSESVTFEAASVPRFNFFKALNTKDWASALSDDIGALESWLSEVDL